jgi:cytochrome c553
VKQYRQLVNGEEPASEDAVALTDLESEVASDSVTRRCAPCHGADGNGREVAAFPKLAGQHPDYFAASLAAYARGERHSGIMEPIAAGLSSEQIHELASYYDRLKLKSHQSSPASQPSAQATERGRAIALRGIPSQDVPACADCHGPSETPHNPNYPMLAGQHADYLALQLTLFKQEQRGGTSYAHLMRRVTAGMNSEQMRDVALYYASLPREKVP